MTSAKDAKPPDFNGTRAELCVNDLFPCLLRLQLK